MVAVLAEVVTGKAARLGGGELAGLVLLSDDQVDLGRRPGGGSSQGRRAGTA